MAKFSAPIAAAMKKYSADEVLPFHTPGHKQGRGAHELLRELLTAEGFRQEVSLMEELDDLHEPHFGRRRNVSSWSTARLRRYRQ